MLLLLTWMPLAQTLLVVRAWGFAQTHCLLPLLLLVAAQSEVQWKLSALLLHLLLLLLLQAYLLGKWAVQEAL
jgi:hypothetical protein